MQPKSWLIHRLPLHTYRDKLLTIELGPKPDSEITKVLNHFIMMHDDNASIVRTKRLLIYRWLMGIPAALFGEISELILVLIGSKGSGKTEWFERILPNELKHYRATDKLDRGKDSDILMTEKLIILDDEFSGKSKKDHGHLKALASTKYFSLRRPYGRSTTDVKRLALLCGTSNPDAVIFDNSGGNRRILPVKISGRDFDVFDSIDKTLLMAQLVHRWKDRNDQKKEAHKLNENERELLEVLSFPHYATSVERDLIDKYIEIDKKEESFYTATEIADYIQDQTRIKISAVRIGQELTNLGFERVQKRDGRNPVYGYYANCLKFEDETSFVPSFWEQRN